MSMLKRQPVRPTKQRSIDAFFGSLAPKEKAPIPKPIESPPTVEVVDPPVREDIVAEDYHVPVITAEDYILDSDYLSEFDEVESSFSTESDESDVPYSTHSSPTPTNDKKIFEIRESSRSIISSKSPTIVPIDIPMPDWHAAPISIDEQPQQPNTYDINEMIKIHYQLEIIEHRIQVGIDNEHQHPALAIDILKEVGLTNESKKDRQYLQRYEQVNDPLFVPTFWEPRSWDAEEAVILNNEESKSLQDTIKTLGFRDGNVSQFVTRRSSWRPKTEKINRPLSAHIEQSVHVPKSTPLPLNQPPNTPVLESNKKKETKANVFNTDILQFECNSIPFSIPSFQDDSMSQDIFGFGSVHDPVYSIGDTTFGFNDLQELSSERLFKPVLSDIEIKSQDSPVREIETNLPKSCDSIDIYQGLALNSKILDFDSQEEFENNDQNLMIVSPQVVKPEEQKLDFKINDKSQKSKTESSIKEKIESVLCQKSIIDILTSQNKPTKLSLEDNQKLVVVKAEERENPPVSEDDEEEQEEIEHIKKTKKIHIKKHNYTINLYSMYFDTDDSNDETDFDDF